MNLPSRGTQEKSFRKTYKAVNGLLDQTIVLFQPKSGKYVLRQCYYVNRNSKNITTKPWANLTISGSGLDTGVSIDFSNKQVVASNPIALQIDSNNPLQVTIGHGSGTNATSSFDIILFLDQVGP